MRTPERSTLITPNSAVLGQSLFRSKPVLPDGVVVGEEPGAGDFRHMQPGRCFNFDGVNDFIDFGLIGDYADNFTVSVWVKTAKKGGRLASRRYTSTSYDFYVDDGGGTAILWSEQQGFIVAGHVAITNNTWSHVCLVVNGDKTRVYTNGIGGAFGNNTGFEATANAYEVGALGALGGGYFQGLMFDHQLFPRALSESEVQQLYQLGTAALPHEPRALWLKSDEQHPSLALDSSGNSRNGTLGNVNATVGNFFYEGADVPHSYQNDKGYTFGSGVYVPRNESIKGLDALGGSLQYKGRCPRNARLVQSNCLTFDGVDDNVDLPATAALDCPDEVTISARVKATTPNLVLYCGQNRFEPYGGITVGLGAESSGSTISITWGPVWFSSIVDPRILSGEEVVVSVSAKSDDVVRFYVNGEFLDEIPAGTFTSYTGVRQIGSWHDVVAFFKGSVADLRIYNRVLTDDEHLHIATQGIQGSDPTSSNLLAHWPMSEGGGAKIHDIGPNAIHGTLTKANLETSWATKQNAYHHNATKGFSLVENLFSQSEPTGPALWNTAAGPADTDFANKLGVVGMCSWTAAAEQNNAYDFYSSSPGTYYFSAVVKMDDGSEPILGTDFRFVVVGATGTQTRKEHLGDNFWFIEASATRFESVPGGSNGVSREAAGYSNKSFKASMFRLYTDPDSVYVRTTGVHTPLLRLPAKAPLTNVLGGDLTNPAGPWHNLAESKIDFTQGAASPGSNGMLTSWHPSTAARNMLPESENFASWPMQVNVTVTPDVATAPDGVAKASKLIETAADSFHYIERAAWRAAPSATFSVYAKAAGRNFIFLQNKTFGGYHKQYFNLADGTLGSGSPEYQARIEDAGNGWWRCSVSHFDFTAGAGTGLIGLASGDESPAYLGDGVSGVYIWGAQIETGFLPTAYEKTKSSDTTFPPEWQAFKRSQTVGGLPRAADRVVLYTTPLPSQRLASTNKFTGTKEVS